jgi:hypothetical protein
MNNKILFILVSCGSFIHSFIAAIIMKDQLKFIRNSIHIPLGGIGGVITEYNINYGFIYFSLVSVYQILEEIGNLIVQGHDKSWYDMEGYILGFSYYVLYLKLISHSRTYEIINNHRRSESL